MALLDIQVTIQMVSGVPNDAATNVWHFDDADIPGSTEGIFDALQAFYNAVRPLYSSLVRQNNHEMKAYRVSDPEPRAPIDTRTWSFSSAPNGAVLPPEVAIVLSYHAEQISGVPQARRRGRVYIGPITAGAMGTDGRFSSTTLNTMDSAVDALVAEIVSWGQIRWSTHSKVLGSGAEVRGAWVDNEPDTQRRRGREATVRVTIPVDQT